MAYDFQVGSCYNFVLYPAAIIGGSFTAVTVMAILDADTARASGADIEALHAKVYSYLPNGTVDNATGYNYLKVKTTSGVAYIGMPWIKESSIVKVENLTITAVISGDKINTNDLTKVRNVLAQAGYTNLKITSSGV